MGDVRRAANLPTPKLGPPCPLQSETIHSSDHSQMQHHHARVLVAAVALLLCSSSPTANTSGLDGQQRWDPTGWRLVAEQVDVCRRDIREACKELMMSIASAMSPPVRGHRHKCGACH